MASRLCYRTRAQIITRIRVRETTTTTTTTRAAQRPRRRKRPAPPRSDTSSVPVIFITLKHPVFSPVRRSTRSTAVERRRNAYRNVCPRVTLLLVLLYYYSCINNRCLHARGVNTYVRNCVTVITRRCNADAPPRPPRVSKSSPGLRCTGLLNHP